LKPLFIPEKAFAEISMDFITDLPMTKKKFTNCLVVMDRLTKAPLLQNIGEITAEATARRLYEIFYPHYGIPRAIISRHRLWACIVAFGDALSQLRPTRIHRSY
jgi:hypothetical protein